MTMDSQSSKLNIWPLMIDMISSILLVFILITFLDKYVNPQEMDLMVVDLKRSAFIRDFEDSFSQEIQDSTVKSKASIDFLRISFSDEILFAKGAYNLIPSGRRMLRKCVSLIESHTQTQDYEVFDRIEVEGHTDASPLNNLHVPTDNWDLSCLRSTEVVRYLSHQGLSPGLFSANGYGPYKPVSEKFKQNRRIELKMFFSTDF